MSKETIVKKGLIVELDDGTQINVLDRVDGGDSLETIAVVDDTNLYLTSDNKSKIIFTGGTATHYMNVYLPEAATLSGVGQTFTIYNDSNVDIYMEPIDDSNGYFPVELLLPGMQAEYTLLSNSDDTKDGWREDVIVQSYVELTDAYAGMDWVVHTNLASDVTLDAVSQHVYLLSTNTFGVVMPNYTEMYDKVVYITNDGDETVPIKTHLNNPIITLQPFSTVKMEVLDGYNYLPMVVGWQNFGSYANKSQFSIDNLYVTNVTASRVPYLDANKKITTSSVTPTELGYLSGATSNIQAQINAIGGSTGNGGTGTNGSAISHNTTGLGVNNNLTAASQRTWYITGNVGQQVYLPATNTLTVGDKFVFIGLSGLSVSQNLNAADGSLIFTLSATDRVELVVLATTNAAGIGEWGRSKWTVTV